jgi:Uma2 family endonuclease
MIMATVVNKSAPAHGVVIQGVTWDDYESMLRIVGSRPIRINYDSGRMEIMSPLQQHGHRSYLLGQLVDVLVDELRMRVVAVDPVTYNRHDLAKGVEPDKAYHFGENALRVRGKAKLDLTIDPPPDLIIEADVTSSSIPRLPIFAALGVPEVWQLDDDELNFLQLQADGSYQPRDHSLAFPGLALADASEFLDSGMNAIDTTWLREFRAFVRDNLVPHP